LHVLALNQRDEVLHVSNRPRRRRKGWEARLFGRIRQIEGIHAHDGSTCSWFVRFFRILLRLSVLELDVTSFFSLSTASGEKRTT